MAVIKSVEIMSWAKIQALFGIVFGLVYGILIGLGLMSIIIFPIIFGIMSFIMGAITAFLYNAFADKIGGIEIELSEK